MEESLNDHQGLDPSLRLNIEIQIPKFKNSFQMVRTTQIIHRYLMSAMNTSHVAQPSNRKTIYRSIILPQSLNKSSYVGESGNYKLDPFQEIFQYILRNIDLLKPYLEKKKEYSNRTKAGRAGIGMEILLHGTKDDYSY